MVHIRGILNLSDAETKPLGYIINIIAARWDIMTDKNNNHIFILGEIIQ